MAGRKQEEDTSRAMAGIVASYVRAQARGPGLEERLPDLARYLAERKLRVPEPVALREMVVRHRDSRDRLAQQPAREAALFAAEGRARPARYRHGSAFCPACGLDKDHRKECGSCGHLEITR